MLGAIKSFLVRHPTLLAAGAAAYGIGRGCRTSFDDRLGVFRIRSGRREIRVARHHATYVRDVVREFDYYFRSVSPHDDGGWSVCDFSRPALHEVPSLGLQFEFASLPEGAETNAAYMQAFGIKAGDVILDLGAYCGLTSYLFARAAGESGRVVAIEADPLNFSCLESNLERLQVKNVAPVHAAVWREAGTLRFTPEGNMGSAVTSVGPRSEGAIEVPAMTLAQIARDAGLTRVDHVKMDIEGAEYEVLRSSEAFIARFRPDFVIEVHKDERGVIDTGAVGRFFEKAGYAVRAIQQSETEWFPLLHATPRAAG